jgi:hypothetical protein
MGNASVREINTTECKIDSENQYLFNYTLNDILIKIAKPENKIDNNRISFICFQKEQLIFSIRRFLQRQNYNHVIIYCYDSINKNTTRHEYYASHSQLSFFRYCIERKTYGGYEKGFNYISSTFINMDLQKFIITNIKKFNFEKTTEEIKCPFPSVLSIRINDPSQNTSNNVFFKLVDEVFPLVETYLDYKESLKKLISSLNDSTFITPNEHKLDIASDIYCILKLNKSHIPINPKNNKIETYNVLKKIFSAIFNKNFEIITEKNKEFENIVSINGLNINITIYRIDIKDKYYNSEYKLYYIKYIYESVEYKNIICIEPKAENTIEITGLNKRYVSSGVFINKVFDYADQTIFSDRLGYVFIGNLSNYSFL